MPRCEQGLLEQVQQFLSHSKRETTQVYVESRTRGGGSVISEHEGGERMRGYRWVWMLCVVLLGGAVGWLHAEDIGCVSTTFRVLGANDKICVSAFDDSQVPGVTCHLSQARTGGMKGTVGVAEDRSRFAIACRQVGPITVDLTKLPKEAEVFSVKTSLIFKETRVVRMVDLTRRTLVYLAYSTRVVEGSPFNSISTVPVMRWEQ